MKKILGSLVIACVAGSSAMAASDRWIHVRVDDAGEGNGRVDIQLPISLVATLLPAIQGKHAHGHVHIDGTSVDLAEMRGYWKAVRSARDGEYVTVRDEDSNVRISKSGGYLRVTVDDRDGSGKVRMKLPVALVDAVLSGGDDIDLGVLSGALSKVESGEILTVDDDDSHVRIWIDDDAAPARGDSQ